MILIRRWSSCAVYPWPLTVEMGIFTARLIPWKNNSVAKLHGRLFFASNPFSCRLRYVDFFVRSAKYLLLSPKTSVDWPRGRVTINKGCLEETAIFIIAESKTNLNLLLYSSYTALINFLRFIQSNLLLGQNVSNHRVQFSLLRRRHSASFY